MPFTADQIRQALARHQPKLLQQTPDDSRASVALILAGTGTDLSLCAIRRAEHPLDPWSGHMALPGGRRHRDDGDLAQTARREAKEEIGLDLSASDLLGGLDDVRPRSQALPPILVRPYVFGLSHSPVLSLSAEVAEWVWVSVAALRESHVHADVEAHGTRLRVPAFVIGDNVIWGLTERIVSNFIGLLATM